MKILHVASEVVPFAKTGGLADVAGSLPEALGRLGHEVKVALPCYGSIDLAELQPAVAAEGLEISLGGASVIGDLLSASQESGVEALLVQNDALYNRSQLYGHVDDAERFSFLCHAVLAGLKAMDWAPDILHCHDWQTGLIPALLKTTLAKDPFFAKTRTVYTVHNLAYQGRFGPEKFPLTGMDWSHFNYHEMEFYGEVSFMKGGLVYADILNAVSEQYAREIQSPELGERLDGVLRERSDRLFGVLNGIDYDEWNPTTDRLIAANYSADNLSGKAVNTRALRERCGLKKPGRKRVPILGCVSRLAPQKGFDLLAEIADALAGLNLQVVVLGAGDEYYTKLFEKLGRSYPEEVSVTLGRFDNEFAHQIYAGSDLFLMPSRYEPCGLGQLISFAYGTIPVVRRTGGLADTVVDVSEPEGTGFVFEEYNSAALFEALRRAVEAHHNTKEWNKLVSRVMGLDFSWDASARRYEGLYQKALAL